MQDDPNQKSASEARGENLDALLENKDFDLATCPFEPLPKYASVVSPPDRKADERLLVFLHDRNLRPCPWEWAWMAQYNLDSGDRV